MFIQQVIVVPEQAYESILLLVTMVLVELGAFVVFAGLVSAWTLWMYGQQRQQKRNDEEGVGEGGGDGREDGDGEEGTRNLAGTYTTGECSYGLARVVPRADDGGKQEEEVEEAKEEDNKEVKEEDNTEEKEEDNKEAKEEVKEDAEEDANKESNEENAEDFEQEAENIQTPDVLFWDGEQYTNKGEEEKKNE